MENLKDVQSHPIVSQLKPLGMIKFIILIQLVFMDFGTDEIKERLGYSITRLMGYVRFERYENYSISKRAIIDTGAHTTVLPYFIWKDLKLK